MGGNSLRDEGATAVCNALKESKVSKLEELFISSNGIGADGAKAIAAYCAVSASLTSCNLRDNWLGEVGWCAVFDALRDNPQNKIKVWELA